MNYTKITDLNAFLSQTSKQLEGLLYFLHHQQKAYEFLARDLEQSRLPEVEGVELDYDMDRVETIAFLMNSVLDYGASQKTCLRIVVHDLKKVSALVKDSQPLTIERETAEGGEL